VQENNIAGRHASGYATIKQFCVHDGINKFGIKSMAELNIVDLS
jgi:hypothetical protein